MLTLETFNHCNHSNQGNHGNHFFFFFWGGVGIRFLMEIFLGGICSPLGYWFGYFLLFRCIYVFVSLASRWQPWQQQYLKSSMITVAAQKNVIGGPELVFEEAAYIVYLNARIWAWVMVAEAHWGTPPSIPQPLPAWTLSEQQRTHSHHRHLSNKELQYFSILK